jgi:hypothetical protein
VALEARRGSQECLTRAAAVAGKARGITLPETDRDLVESCADRTQLEYWADRALQARNADDIFRPR